jgi:hypothetical protein
MGANPNLSVQPLINYDLAAPKYSLPPGRK